MSSSVAKGVVNILLVPLVKLVLLLPVLFVALVCVLGGKDDSSVGNALSRFLTFRF